MNLVSYLCVFVKRLFYYKFSHEESNWSETSLERRKQYLEQRRQEIKRLLWETENPTLIKLQ